jgi:hypothetical protein
MRPIAWFVGLSILLSPFFFVLFRLAVFNTVPHDDYAPYLLWLDGNARGGIPESPYCYRLLSMVMAWPLFRLMPAIPLTNLPPVMSDETVRAVAALTMLSYVASIATALLTYRLGRKEGGLDRGHAMAAGGLAWALGWYTQITAIDALALLFITAALCAIRTPWAFGVLLLASVGVNEKIALVLAIWLVIRGLLDAGFRRDFAWQIVLAIGAVGLYALLVAVLKMPGNEYQLRPGGFADTITENLTAYATSRGLFLNVLPITVLAALAIGARSTRLFRRMDVLLIPALTVVALVLTHLFQAGRIVMHAAPLFVVPAVAALQGRTIRGAASRT